MSSQKDGDYHKAITHYSEIIKAHPHIADVYINRAAAYVSIGDLDLAFNDLNMALKLEPKFIAYCNRGSVYFKKRDYERAILDYNAALELDPGNASAHVYRGQTFTNLSLYDYAIRDFKEALALNPNNTIAHTGIGIVYSNIGDHGKAIKNYNEALKLDPDYPFVYLNRGFSHNARGDSDSAEKDFSKALELNPEYSDAYGIRSLVFIKRGEIDRALGDLNSALRLDPHHPYAHAVRGTLYLEKGELDRAIEDFDKALAQVPENEIAYNSRGIAYERKGDLARAMRDYDQALRIRPNQAAHANRGFALLRLSRWDEARSDLLSARNMGMDIVSAFRADHGSVAAFEEKHNLKLPQDIADLVSVEESPQPSAIASDDVSASLNDLREVVNEAVEEGFSIPSDLAFENTEHLLNRMFEFLTRRCEVYPTPDGEIAIDIPNGRGSSIILLCNSEGGVLCLVNLGGSHRRKSYPSADAVPDKFLRDCLMDLER